MIDASQVLIVSEIVMEHIVISSCSWNHRALGRCKIRLVQILRCGSRHGLHGWKVLQQHRRNAIGRGGFHIVCELRRFNLKRESLRQSIARAFVRSKEKGLLSDDWAAYARSELIEYLWRSL